MAIKKNCNKTTPSIFSHSIFDVGRSMFDVHLFVPSSPRLSTYPVLADPIRRISLLWTMDHKQLTPAQPAATDHLSRKIYAVIVKRISLGQITDNRRRCRRAIWYPIFGFYFPIQNSMLDVRCSTFIFLSPRLSTHPVLADPIRCSRLPRTIYPA